MQILNIVLPEKYEKDGEEKTAWNQVGKLIVKDDGKMFIKMHMSPGVVFQVFEPKEKE